MPAASTTCASFTANAYLNANGASGDTLASLATGLHDYGSGVGSWAPVPATPSTLTRAYRVSWWLPDVDPDTAPQAAIDALNDLQGLSASVDLTWEARS